MSDATPGSRPGSTVFVQQVRDGCEAAYREWSCKINSACAEFPGFLDLEVFEPAERSDGSFVIAIRFQSDAQLAAWQNSATCQTLVKAAAPILKHEVRHAPSSVFGGWFSNPSPRGATHGRIPPWKEALIVLLTLYPAVMLLTLYVVGPLTKDWSMATSMYLGNIASVALLTWVLMPYATRKLADWIHPPPNAGRANLLRGLAVVLSMQWIMVALFHFYT